MRSVKKIFEGNADGTWRIGSLRVQWTDDIKKDFKTSACEEVGRARDGG